MADDGSNQRAALTLPTLDQPIMFMRRRTGRVLTATATVSPTGGFGDFGNLLETATNLDAAGNLLGDDYTNGVDPNVIQFTLSTTNLYVNSATVAVQLNVTGGDPDYYALLINGQTTTNWLPFFANNLPVFLGTTDGVYVVSVGLRGLPADATETWASLAFTRDTAPPALTLTNLPALTGSRPFIDPAGYVTKALSSLTYTVVDANGTTNTGNGMVNAAGLIWPTRYHVTNQFQMRGFGAGPGSQPDFPASGGLAGNVGVTNFVYVFDRTGT